MVKAIIPGEVGGVAGEELVERKAKARKKKKEKKEKK